MLKPKAIRTVIQYWVTTAEHDYETMDALFTSKRYSDCLFFGHIILEKILKAHAVATTKKHAPYIHDLVRLAQLANVVLTQDKILFLNEVNDFNIRARYPEDKLDFYKLCTKKYTAPPPNKTH